MATKKKEATKTTDKVVEVRKEAAEEIPEGGFIYVGPTVSGLGIQNAIYTDIPDEARVLFASNPVLRNLFIPLTDWPRANEMIRTQSGYIWAAWQAAASVRPSKKFVKKATE